LTVFEMKTAMGEWCYFPREERPQDRRALMSSRSLIECVSYDMIESLLVAVSTTK
jgi:hypothetical protein